MALAAALVGALLFWRSRGTTRPTAPVPDKRGWQGVKDWKLFKKGVTDLVAPVYGLTDTPQYVPEKEAFYTKYHRYILGYFKGYDINPTFSNMAVLKGQVAAYLHAGGRVDPDSVPTGSFIDNNPISND